MTIERVRIEIAGAVQGVGFRPFIYRLASEFGVAGWVNNSAQGVIIEAEAPHPTLESFLESIETQKPAHAFIQSLQAQFLPPAGYKSFEIHHSENGGAKTAVVLPDLATCPECLVEINNPHNRRYRYPFANCTHCGPRFSIIRALPYDRPNTTMRAFEMCDECRAEYENPLDRRFHAQPNACPKCGPQLALWTRTGETLWTRDEALVAAARAIHDGLIVAVKGLGGFHLMVDARNDEAVALLRQRKHRYEKPLALMYPSLEQASADCEVGELEAQLLTSAQAPIVLLRRKSNGVSSQVAPGNPYLGVMLPYTPLHHLLLGELNFPVVATSGNLSGEPICTDEYEALERLQGIADLFLVHDRPIERHVDDSIMRVAAGREMMLRRARGYAPLPLQLPQSAPTLIATGAHQKNTVAVSAAKQVFISQHIGDMDTTQAYEAFQHVIADFRQLYELQPQAVVCDLHPDYRSTQYAESSGLPVVRVQHHYAHVLSCMAENDLLDTPVLGVAWDGTGYGLDGTVWGGEFLHVGSDSFVRAAHLRTFRLPGGEQAVKEPRRTALGLLYEIFGDDIPPDLLPVQAFSQAELNLVKTMLRKGLNAPLTSSMGRLFDAVASLTGVRQQCSYEGQAAMELEFRLEGTNTDKCYPFTITDITSGDAPSRYMIDYVAMVMAVIADVGASVPVGEISAKFHNTLCEIILAVAHRMGEEHVLLTGGCFQNKTLLETAINRLQSAGFRPHWQRLVPPNDGGIALGQIIAGIRACV